MNNNYTNLNSLVKAEYAFSAKSKHNGIREAFLFFLSDESIVFRPTPTNGKKWYRNQAEISGELTWFPVLADVSKAGDLGYTTGPWEYKNKNENGETASVFGHYVSVWRKQSDGQWKVEFDAGISHHKSIQPFSKLSVKNLDEKSIQLKYNKNKKAEISSLLKTDNEFSRISKREGFSNAFKNFSSTTVRLYRENHFPLVEKEQIYKILTENDGFLKWKPENAKVSISTDLGYTYGIAEFWSKTNNAKSEPDEKRCYMRIWKKESEGKWKIVLDIENPIQDLKNQ
jgi:ketosteroid isomerase-like protein